MIINSIQKREKRQNCKIKDALVNDDEQEQEEVENKNKSHTDEYENKKFNLDSNQVFDTV